MPCADSPRSGAGTSPGAAVADCINGSRRAASDGSAREAAGRVPRTGRARQPRGDRLRPTTEASPAAGEAHRRITGHQVQPLTAQEPRSRRPARVFRVANRQRIADNRLETLAEHPAQARPLDLVVQAGVERIDVGREAALAPQVIPDVFVPRLHVRVGDGKFAGQGLDESLGVQRVVSVRPFLIGPQRRVNPRRRAVVAPVTAERPPWQLFPWVPFPLASVNEPVRSVVVLQPVEEFERAEPLGGPIAAVFHSTRRDRSPTNVGSPPIVSRTSWRASSASTACPSRTMSFHCVSV